MKRRFAIEYERIEESMRDIKLFLAFYNVANVINSKKT